MWNMNLDFDATNQDNRTNYSMSSTDGIYENNAGLPYKTLEELERYHYMKGDTQTASLLGILSDLDTALAVAAQLDDA
jgi:hypothetical protein